VEDKHTGLCYYMLTENSPLRLPLVKALLSGQRLHTFLVDLSFKLIGKESIMSNLECCGGRYESRLADLIGSLKDESWEPIQDDLSGAAGQILLDEVQNAKDFDFQAILDTKPTVFLTICDQYDHDVRKALLDLINRSSKILQGGKQALIRS
jgi:hypothetical protein